MRGRSTKTSEEKAKKKHNKKSTLYVNICMSEDKLLGELPGPVERHTLRMRLYFT